MRLRFTRVTSIVVSVVVLVAAFLVRAWLTQTNTEALSYALVHDVARFADVHSHRLPGSWAEF
jgi:di/tricarboxylate transporter